MAIKDLKKDITKNGGYILSDGTLNLKHLLPKAYDLIVSYNLSAKEIKNAIESVFENTDEETTEKLEPTFINQYYNDIYIPDNKQEEASYIWNEDIYNYFQSICPKNYFFGSTEGDGACIGFFKYNDESEEF